MKLSRLLPDIGGIYCLVVLLALTGFAGETSLFDGDTLWHIKAGEIMLERGEILTYDIFSHTVQGQLWLAHEWLAEIIMALLHGWAGLPGVVIFFFLLASLTYWLLFRVAEPYGNPWLAVFCVSVALVLSLMHLLARPHIFTWFFGALTLFLLIRDDPRVYFLPLLTAIWANLHGGFVLGLVLQGLFLTGRGLERGWRTFLPNHWASFFRDQRRPILVLALCIAAVGINPFGYKLLVFPFQVSAKIFSTSVSEWIGPNMQENWPFRFFILFIIFLLFFRGPQISWTSRLFVLFFLNQSMLHARHVSIAGIFLTPFLLEALNPSFKRAREKLKSSNEQQEISLSKTSGPIAAVIFSLILIALGAHGSSAIKGIYSGLFPLPEKYSRTAVEFLMEHPPEGKMFNQDDFGDYIIYALGQDYPVFIDGRLDMYGEEIIKDYIKIRNVDENTDNLLKSYDVSWVIFPKSQPLVVYLKENANWEEVFADDQISVLVRKTPERP